jgi:AcrR family transcriptional regulator
VAVGRVNTQSRLVRPIRDDAGQTVSHRSQLQPSEAKRDRRVQRTRRSLQQALLQLMVEKGYEAVTVQDISDRADVGRSTFYAHFLDKEQLLLSRLEELRVFLAEQQRKAMVRSDNTAEQSLGFSLAMLEHAREHRELFRALVGKRGGAVVEGHIRDMFADLVRVEISTLAAGGPTVAPEGALVQYTVGAFMALIGWWMEHDMPSPPDEMDRLVRTLTIPGIVAGLARATPTRRRSG